MPYTKTIGNVCIMQHCGAFASTLFPLPCHVPCVLLTYMLLSILKAMQQKHNNALYLLLHYICCCQQYETHLGLHVMCLNFLSNFNHIWIFWTDFHVSSQYQILWKSV
jgi:hypothetical protein